MEKLIIITIHERQEKENLILGFFLIPGITPREILKRLGCPNNILVRFLNPKVFWPDENVYKCVSEGDQLEVIPIVWKDAPWLPTKTWNGNDRPEGLRDLDEPFEFQEDVSVN
ncbi:hypothetical protein MUO65_05835 [bacterium]|nr:hypothetical protein [bacterium]